MHRFRLVLDIVLAVGFFFLPWWALFLLALPGLVLFPLFGEVIILGFFIDIFFREPSSGITPLWLTLLGLALVIVSRLVKKGLRLEFRHELTY